MPATGGGVAGVAGVEGVDGGVDGGVAGIPVPIGDGVAASPPPPPPQATLSIKTNAPIIHTFPFRRFFNQKPFICSDILTSPVALFLCRYIYIMCEYFTIIIVCAIIYNDIATNKYLLLYNIHPLSISFKYQLTILLAIHLYLN